MDTKITIPAHIRLEGACNARDLGGYNTPEGRTKRFAFIRSESPARLTQQDIALLLKLGVRTVIDLRNIDEAGEDPSPFLHVPTITTHNIPLLNIDASPHALEGVEMGDLYVYMLDQCQASFLRVFRTILTANRGIIFHCAAGKDRTGMVAAMLLLLARVNPETVVEEYTSTQTLLAPWVEQEKKKLSGTIKDSDDMYAAKSEYMWKAINHLNREYGSIIGYLMTIGMDSIEIDLLKNKMLAPQAKAGLPDRYSA